MITNQEEFYDREIAPVLAELAKKCQEKNISFCASVEYDPEHMGRGKTEFQAATKPVLEVSCAQILVHYAARCNGNVDALFMAIEKWAAEHGHNSIYLSSLENYRKSFGLAETKSSPIS